MMYEKFKGSLHDQNEMKLPFKAKKAFSTKERKLSMNEQ